MIQNWTSPLVNALTTEDATTLQRIFSSLSLELASMRKEMEQMKQEMTMLRAPRRAYAKEVR
jgi:hypothetical protein